MGGELDGHGIPNQAELERHTLLLGAGRSYMMADSQRFVAAVGAVLSLSCGVQCFLAQSSVRLIPAVAPAAKQQEGSGIRVDSVRREVATRMAAESRYFYGR